MFRITPIVSTARLILLRRSTVEFPIPQSVTTLYRNAHSRIKDRDTCLPPPPPPPPPPKDDKLLWGTIAAAILAGAVVVYAKQNPELRDWLTIYAPWFDDFIAIAYQENMSYQEYADRALDYLKNCAEWLKNDDSTCVEDGTPAKIEHVPADVKPEPQVIEEIPDDEDDEDDEHRVRSPNKYPCIITPPPIIEKDICELERCFKELLETTYFNYMTARDACFCYNNCVKEALDDFNFERIHALRAAMAERKDLVSEAMDCIEDSKKKTDDLSRFLECGVQVPEKAKDNTRAVVREWLNKIDIMRIEYEWELDKAIAFDAEWQMVEQTIDKFIEENQTMFPGLKLDVSKPSLKGDPDLYLHHAIRNVKKLRGELDEAAVGMSDRVDRAIASLPPKKERAAEIQNQYRVKKAEMDREFANRTAALRAELDRQAKEAIKMQSERHETTLKTKLKNKEDEIMAKFDKMVQEKVAKEKLVFDAQLADMARKLKIVEDKLNARLQAERESRKSQQLWSAAAALLAATNKGDPCIKVNRELEAIEKAGADGDKLVATVLKSIPDSVREKGVVPESVLREKYHQMESTALKVALVESDGSPLPVYFLSWLQSLLLFMKMSSIPKNEIESPPAEPPPEMDTFDLLQRARYHIDHGNLPLAYRYVSALQGASAAAAASWRRDAGDTLRARQAASAVSAHAVSTALRYL